MHNIGSVQPHTTVEAYGVHHILMSNLSFMERDIKEEVETIVAKVKGMEKFCTEQNEYLGSILKEYYYNKNKYEMIYLIRRMTQERIHITFKYVPFFQIIVRDFMSIVREARCIVPIEVIKH